MRQSLHRDLAHFRAGHLYRSAFAPLLDKFPLREMGNLIDG